jgi:GDP-L-fucose synthase
MENYDDSMIVNIGTGYDHSIKEYVEIARKLFNYTGEINWDTSKPDGMYEKRTDITRLKSIMPEFKPRSFEEGLKETVKLDFGMGM